MKDFLKAMEAVGMPTLIFDEEGVMASKAYVEYRDYPKGTQQCAGCTMFKPPNSCTYVDGRIDPEGWCKAYEQKVAAMETE